MFCITIMWYVNIRYGFKCFLMWLQAWRDQRKSMKHVDERRRTAWHRVKWATLSFKCYSKENLSSQNLNRDQKCLSSPNVSKQASEESVPCLFAPVTEILLFQSKISLCSMSNYKLCWTVGPPPVELFCSWLMSCSALRCARFLIFCRSANY